MRFRDLLSFPRGSLLTLLERSPVFGGGWRHRGRHKREGRKGREAAVVSGEGGRRVLGQVYNILSSAQTECMSTEHPPPHSRWMRRQLFQIYL